MSPDLWPEVRRLFDDLVDRPAAEQESVLLRGGRDARIVAEVRQLLDASELAGNFLETAPSLEPLASAFAYRSLPHGARVGPFRIDALVGQGGHGEVYCAQRADGAFDQRVALKLLRAEALSQFANFYNERQILASLEHPGIARLIEGGIAPDGRPYMAMEFVEGEDIDVHCARLKLGLPARLELILEVIAAVAEAHRHLVVHRDLKPGNILVTPGGAIKLLDFGIARLVVATGDNPALTAAISTPAYAAPEQLVGGHMTVATDVYALGAILFELTTGQSPWRIGDMPLSFASRVLRDEPPLASTVSAGQALPPVVPPLLRGDIDAIIAKAMRHRAGDRYAAVEALADDLRRFLSHRPVAARKGNAAYRTRRFIRRNKVPLLAVAAVFLAIAVGGAGTAVEMRHAALAREAARIEASRVEAGQDYLTLLLRSASSAGGAMPSTSRGLLDLAAAQLEREAALGPVAPGLVKGIGTLYFDLEEYDAAAPYLDRYAALAETRADAAESARIMQMQAVIAIRRGDYARVDGVLDRAAMVWATDPARYGREAAELQGVRAALLRERGERSAAIALLRRALAGISDALGPHSTDATSLRRNLGVHLLESGKIGEAKSLFADVDATLVRQGRLQSPAAFTNAADRAQVAFLEGRVGEAKTLWQAAIDHRRSAYGRSEALAGIEVGYARALLSLGEADKALPLFDEALRILTASSGPAGVLRNVALQSRGLAYLALGDVVAGQRDIEEAVSLARAHFGATSIYYGMALMARADLAFMRSERQAAATDVADAIGIFDAIGPAAKTQRDALRQMEALLAGP